MQLREGGDARGVGLGAGAGGMVRGCMACHGAAGASALLQDTAGPCARNAIRIKVHVVPASGTAKVKSQRGQRVHLKTKGEDPPPPTHTQGSECT
jgi:hypothetical protein